MTNHSISDVRRSRTKTARGPTWHSVARIGGEVYNPAVMRKWLSACVAVAVVAMGAPAARAQAPAARQKVDVSKLGPQVGQRVPDFSLRDQTGRTQTLQSVMGPRGAMLVFFRSADW